jgi:hypothetical protein
MCINKINNPLNQQFTGADDNAILRNSRDWLARYQGIFIIDNFLKHCAAGTQYFSTDPPAGDLTIRYTKCWPLGHIQSSWEILATAKSKHLKAVEIIFLARVERNVGKRMKLGCMQSYNKSFGSNETFGGCNVLESYPNRTT